MNERFRKAHPNLHGKRNNQSMKPPLVSASRAARLMCLNRSGPSKTPPNQRVTTTKTFSTRCYNMHKFV